MSRNVADPQVLGKFLLIQSTLHVMPDADSLAEFICRGLTDVPGTNGVSVCVGGCLTRISAEGLVHSWVDRCRLSSGEKPSGPETGVTECPRSALRDLFALPMKTVNREYGTIFIKLDEPAIFETYKPFLENIANLAAVLQENRAHEDRLKRLNEDLKQQVSQKETAELALRRVKDNLEQSVLARTRELKSANMSLAREVRERKRAEASLKDRERQFRTLVENIPGIVYRRQAENPWHPIFFSDDIMTLTGYGSDRYVSQKLTYSGHISPADLPRVERAIQTGIEEKASYEVEYKIRNREGDNRWVLEKGRIVFDDQHRSLWVDGVILDITEQKRLREERQVLEEKLLQAQKMEAIGTLAGGIAHDFNNILAAIIGYTELARDNCDHRSSVFRNLNEVMVAGNRAKDLVQQILTFARVTEKEIKPTPVYLIIKEALKLLRSSLPVTINIERQIASNAMVMADPTHIHQIIMNLCTNAAQSMEPSGGLLAVSLTNVDLDASFTETSPNLVPGKYVKLTVTDTGKGIRPELIPFIFEPYFTTKKAGEGTGLGLAVAHSIVNECRGEISVRSEPGIGSTFTIYLPAVASRAEPDSSREQELPTGNESILFVDDELPIVNVAERMLTQLGYRVTATTSAAEALSIFRQNPDQFDLVISDVTMPEMTGDALAESLTKLNPDIRIVLCTGFSTRITQESAAAMGIQALIMKPIVRRDLAAIIRQVLDGSKEG